MVPDLSLELASKFNLQLSKVKLVLKLKLVWGLQFAGESWGRGLMNDGQADVHNIS